MARIKEKNLTPYKIRKFNSIASGTIFKYPLCSDACLYIKIYRTDNTNGICLQDGSPAFFESDDLIIVVTDIEYELEKE